LVWVALLGLPVLTPRCPCSFHNYTGNRVTCRDWFQLSLKEGLTVYRDQEFSSDMNSRPVKRIEDVRLLRARQFGEDGGPMAHPIRPTSVEKIDNFYTRASLRCMRPTVGGCSL
jgi:aminopeptidase N